MGTKKLVAELLGISIEELADFMAYLVSLHDIGKIEYHFQCKDPEMRAWFAELGVDRKYVGSPNIRHERTGARAIRQLWRAQGQSAASSNLFSDLIGAHHQNNYGTGSDIKDPYFTSYQEELEREMCHYFLGKENAELPGKPRGNRGIAECVMLGLMILSDWIASGETFSGAEEWINNASSDAEISLRVKEFLQTSGLGPNFIGWGDSFGERWPWISPDNIRPLQLAAEGLGKECRRHTLILMEAPISPTLS